MKAQRVFRIERGGEHDKNASTSGSKASSSSDDQPVLAAIAELKSMLQASAAKSDGAPAQVSPDNEFFEKYRTEMAEALKLKAELDSIHEAISETKTEIATLRFTSLDGDETARVTDELGAVVEGTEQATETILSSAEWIDECAGNLAAKLDGDDQGMANDIQDRVVSIFEACNFQDITGQRITKVVTAMKFIEERVDRMMGIWGGIDTFSEIAPIVKEQAEGDDALLNGPSLETDDDVASQDDIDALFD